MVRDTAGPQYAAGGVRRALLGGNWRELWLTPVDVPVLDLQRYGGGLTPVRAGGNQSRTLHFDGGDGRRYVFRTAGKRLAPRYNADLLGTPAGAIVEDQLSTLHPVSLLLAHVLEEAAGVLHPEPLLVQLPDDEQLGEFRETFASALGFVAERPDNVPEGVPPFADADQIIGADGMVDRMEESFAYRLDARAWLVARLIDGILGDFDRGADQWEFACYHARGTHTCRPIARDRDWAFMRANGLVMRLLQSSIPRIASFDDAHVEMRRLTAMTREFDRTQLVELPWAVWDSVTTALKLRLTDAVMDEAVLAQPEGYRVQDASRVVSASLRARRDGMPALAREFYLLVNTHAEVFGTDSSEVVDIERGADGSVRVQVRAGDTMPAIDRTFIPSETREIRVHLLGGDDRVVVRGSSDPGIVVRVTGGAGDDVLADSSRVSTGGTGTWLYDASGNNTILAGSSTRVDTRPYVTAQPSKLQPDEDKPEPPRLVQEERRGRFQDQWNNAADSELAFSDGAAGAGQSWGRRRAAYPVVAYKDGAGVIVGAALRDVRHGFRANPHSSALGAAVYYALGSRGLGLQVDGDWRPLNSSRAVIARGRVSQFESQRFYGYGNQTPRLPTAQSRIIRDEVTAGVAMRWYSGAGTHLTVGPLVRWVQGNTVPDAPAPAQTLAAGAYGAVGASATFEHLAVDRPATPHRGYRISLGATSFADAWSAGGAFGRATGEIVTYAPLASATLALRAGGRQNWGSFPVHEAALLGGRSTLRGHDWNRFTGDAMAYGSGELRVPVARVELLARGDLGLILLADAGRVWVDGGSPGGWHTATGAGLSFTTLGRAVSVVYARGETGRLHAYLGFPF